MTDIEHNENLWGYRKRLNFVRDAIASAFPGRPPSTVSILDVGCGSGTQLGVPLARRGYAITGIDLHEPSIAVAKGLTRGHSNASFGSVDINDLEKHDFDVVVLSEVLEHVSDPQGLLNSAVEHMNANGLAIVTVPNGYGEFEWDSWVFRTFGFESMLNWYVRRKGGANEVVSSTENHDSGHIQFFTMRRLESMFDRCRLEVVGSAASTFLSGPFAGHLLGRFGGFVEWNARVSDRLPMSAASGWYFSLRRRAEAAE